MAQQEQPVTQKDFELFKQEMKNGFDSFTKDIKHEFLLFKEEMSNRFELYLSRIDTKTKETINDRLNIATKWVIGLGTLFVVLFAGYFEYMRTKVDQINSDRISQIESNIATMNQFVMGSSRATDKDTDKKIIPHQPKKENP